MGVTEEELHPLQQIRLDKLREAIDFIEHGQVPPQPMPCFNLNCFKPAELFEYKDERGLREFVVGGPMRQAPGDHAEGVLRVCRPRLRPQARRGATSRHTAVHLE